MLCNIVFHWKVMVEMYCDVVDMDACSLIFGRP
jgi:hypothetical protein